MSEMTIQNAVEAFNATTTKLAKDLTKREYFAAMAMQGMCGNEDQRSCPENRRHELWEWRMDCYKEDARVAIMYADALLAELAKEKKE